MNQNSKFLPAGRHGKIRNSQHSTVLVGVLCLQGDFKEHLLSLEKYGVHGREVREKSDLKGLDALILPGGESTVIAKLLLSTGLDKAIIQLVQDGLPLWGTCAGAILMAKHVEGAVLLETQLQVLDVDIVRNAYGRQAESFVTDLRIDGHVQRAFFIRAPQITRVGKGVSILLRHKGLPVMVRKKHLFATTFHSEMSEKNIVLEVFLQHLK